MPTTKVILNLTSSTTYPLGSDDVFDADTIVPRQLPARVSRPLYRGLACALLLTLSGGGWGNETATLLAKTPAASSALHNRSATVQAVKPVGDTAIAVNGGALDPGLMLLIVPDTFSASDPRIAGWIDAAIELGVRVLPVTDKQFAGLGDKALKFAGVILPDDIHAVASDTQVQTIRDYVNRGGSVMLAFDFGALTLNAVGQPFYAPLKSRLSDLAGVDYILYDELRDRTTGLGPVTGMRSTLRLLQVPPGKSMPYSTIATAQTATMPDTPFKVHPQARSAKQDTALYLPTNVTDPGGVRGFDPQQYSDVRKPSLRERVQRTMRRQVATDYGKAITAAAPVGITRTQPTGNSAGAPTRFSTAAIPDVLDAYTSYLIGNMVYPSYVTRGAYDGVVLATSPQFGLIAGVRQQGLGKVLFVNLPLSYLKGRTDALPMHGFLGYFARQVLKLPSVSPMPGAIAGLTLDWHFDSSHAQQPTLDLEQMGVFAQGPFSIEMTAGPDAVDPGDRLGWDLDHNLVAQSILKRMDVRGHAVASHGGWVHDYFGLNASESNRAEFEPLLALNMNSVDSVIGRPARSYSAPEGNNPRWAMNWLESRGIVAAYFGGHTGLGPTRLYRDGALRNPKITVFPVTPQGMYATFEEWQQFSIPKADVVQWYHDLVDFSIQHDTSRLVYMHPPGAALWPDVLQDLQAYATSKGTGFRWYTMPRLADFMAKRLTVKWTQMRLANGSMRFNASNAAGLGEITWRVSKSLYLKPTFANAASGTVTENSTDWLVKPGAVTTVEFTAKPAA